MGDIIKTIKAAQKGDVKAFETLYNEYSRNVYFLALKLMKNNADAEDMTQEVFLSAFQKIRDLKEPENFSAWLNRITVNKCTESLQKKKLLISADTEEISAIEFIEETDRSLIPDKSLDNAETARIIIEIIDNLRLCIILVEDRILIR